MKTANHNQKSSSLDLSSDARCPKTRKSTGGPAIQFVGGDPVSDVLETVRLRGALFFLYTSGRSKSVGVADGRKISRHILPGSDTVISYHIVVGGSCWAAVDGEEPLYLESGDILVLPRGDAYKIADEIQYPTEEDEAESLDFFRSMAAGEIPPVVTEEAAGPQSIRLICGFLGCDLRPYNPLLSSLPCMIRIPAPAGGHDPLSFLIDFALTESGQTKGGERCLLARLSEVMFVEVMRRYLRSSSASNSAWLEGLRHPVVGKALRLLHHRARERWTLERLAQAVGTSRSTLAERFVEIVGEPPMQYLLHWRMQLAANRLSDSSAKLYTVAREVGYESEVSFSRAFKRVVGEAPSTWRARRTAGG